MIDLIHIDLQSNLLDSGLIQKAGLESKNSSMGDICMPIPSATPPVHERRVTDVVTMCAFNGYSLWKFFCVQVSSLFFDYLLESVSMRKVVSKSKSKPSRFSRLSSEIAQSSDTMFSPMFNSDPPGLLLLLLLRV
mmetsp:Transcript_36488/g.49352  ORF Transcript_36488/g.49352 Transcript_36488/m.49352 type:complete len:135 (+) Transcript_36488:137-541(+)